MLADGAAWRRADPAMKKGPVVRPFAAVLLLSLWAPVASADQPLESVDAFEGAITRCLTTSPAPAGCFEAHMRGRFPPGNERLDGMVSQLHDLFRQWIGKDKVFAVHAVKTVKLGAFAERRVYLIEDTTGSLMMLDAAFIRRLGKLYLLKFNLTSTQSEVKAALGEVL